MQKIVPYFLCFATALLTLYWGDVPWHEVLEGVLLRWAGKEGWNALLDERLPRLLVLWTTGASLAVAGAVMQGLFRNPLASPEVLGMNSGGNLIMIFGFLWGWHHHFPFIMPCSAVLGSLITLCVVYTLSRSMGMWHERSLIFIGIAFATVLTAIEGGLVYMWRHDWQLIQTIIEWQASSTADRHWLHVHMQLPLALVGIGGVLWYRKEINLLSMGEEDALILGVDVKTVRWRLFFFVSLLTGGALAALGIIPFFGLVLPHILRRIVGPNHNRLIPICIVGGAAALAALDLTLRIGRFHAISIGHISSFLGGIFFLFLLFSPYRHKQESHG